MWVISQKRLQDFWNTVDGAKSKKALELWYRVVGEAQWSDYADVKRTYGARFDIVGDCGVFDVCGNDFRLITRMRFKSHKVFVLKVMTHKVYDKGTWKTDCGCFQSPPEKPRSTKTRGRRKKSA